MIRGERDVSAVVQQCRKETNGRYTCEDATGLEESLESGGHTLNLPFCFTQGAMQLKQSLMHVAYNSLAGGGGHGSRWCTRLYSFSSLPYRTSVTICSRS
jgi:hypothetical protein